MRHGEIERIAETDRSERVTDEYVLENRSLESRIDTMYFAQDMQWDKQARVGVEYVGVGSDMDLHGYDATTEYGLRREKLREIGQP